MKIKMENQIRKINQINKENLERIWKGQEIKKGISLLLGKEDYFYYNFVAELNQPLIDESVLLQLEIDLALESVKK